MKEVSAFQAELAFLDMRRCKTGIMKSVPKNISLSKDWFHQFPGTQSASLSTLNPPQGVLKA